MDAKPRTLRLSLNAKSTEIRNALEACMPWIRALFGEDSEDLV